MSAQFEFKQVIVVRTDIKMSVGKTAVQVAHASVSALLWARRETRFGVDRWLREGQKQVVVKVSSLGELEERKRRAEALGLPCEVVSDAGLTELEPGTVTALGIGPAPSHLVDKVTGDLPLL